MITPFQLDSKWRDYWGQWNPPANAQFAPLVDNKCYQPRIRMAPAIDQQIMPASGKIDTTFYLPPGSLMWAFWPSGASGTCVIQLTDITLGHRFFQEPLSTATAVTSIVLEESFSYSLLPTPHPVVGSGLFRLEIWGVAGTRYFVIFGIAEVSECLL